MVSRDQIWVWNRFNFLQLKSGNKLHCCKNCNSFWEQQNNMYNNDMFINKYTLPFNFWNCFYMLSLQRLNMSNNHKREGYIIIILYMYISLFCCSHWVISLCCLPNLFSLFFLCFIKIYVNQEGGQYFAAIIFWTPSLWPQGIWNTTRVTSPFNLDWTWIIFYYVN